MIPHVSPLMPFRFKGPSKQGARQQCLLCTSRLLGVTCQFYGDSSQLLGTSEFTESGALAEKEGERHNNPHVEGI